MKKRKSFCEWCVRAFAAVMREIAPTWCIKYWTKKYWKDGSENRYAAAFLPCVFDQIRVSKKLTKKELEARFWSSPAICVMLIQPGRNFTLDEILRIDGTDCPAFIGWARNQKENIISYIKIILPWLDDERLKVKDDDYQWWIQKASSFFCLDNFKVTDRLNFVAKHMMTPEYCFSKVKRDVENFLFENEVCLNNLNTNPKWKPLREAIMAGTTSSDLIMVVDKLQPTNEESIRYKLRWKNSRRY